MEGMNRKIGVGVFWNIMNMLMSRGATMLFMLLLARFVAPEAFGLLAMAAVVFELASVFITSGLGTALIRSKNVSEADLSTVFYTNIILSIIAYSLLFLAAPYIANFYKQPELTSIVQVMGLVVFFNASKLVQVAVLSRAMNFKAQMGANTAGAIGSGAIAVIAAWKGLGVWSLVLQMLSASFITSLVLWVQSSWRPSLSFSLESFYRLLRFGKNLLAEGFLEILFQNSYVLVIGRFYSAEVTGLYYFARKITNIVSHQLTGAVQQATFPALATLQMDHKKLLLKYRQVLQIMMFAIVPVMALIAISADVWFQILFDERWQGAVPYVALLCIAGMLYPIHSLNINLLNVLGRSDLVLKVGIIKKATAFFILLASIPFGVLGIVIGQVLASFIALIPNTYFSSRLVGYSLTKQLKDAFTPIACAGLSSLFCFVFLRPTSFNSFWELAATVFLFIVSYVFMSLLFKNQGGMLLLHKFKKKSR